MPSRVKLQSLKLKSHMGVHTGVLDLENHQDCYTYISIFSTGEFQRAAGMSTDLASCELVRDNRYGHKIHEVNCA